MKNIHLIPTDKPSRLVIDTIENKLSIQYILHEKTINVLPQHIYITSNEEIKDGDWVLFSLNDITEIVKVTTIINNAFESKKGFGYGLEYCQKVILTDNQDLIKDGVQAVNDEFLEWFVNNPSREEEQKQHLIDMMRYDEELGLYEEPKQETLEEVIKREYEARKFNSNFPFDPQSFKLGAKWQAEQDKNKYSEEEVLQLIINCKERFGGSDLDDYVEDSKVIKWFEQLKKK